MLFEKNECWTERIVTNFDNCFLAESIPKTGYENRELKWFTTDISSRNISTPYNDEIFYKFNNHGYRSEEFKRRLINVMTVGCSFTFGNGIPANRRFSRIFCNLLGEDVSDWNLSWPGVSIDYVARIVSTCVPVLKPDIILVNFPPLARREFFDAQGYVFAHRIQRKTHCNKESDLHNAHLSLVSSYQDLYRFLMNYKLIESISKQHNVPWLFSTQKSDQNAYDKIHHHIDESLRVDCLDKIDSARDGGHPGVESNMNHALNYFDKYRRKYEVDF